VRPTNAKLDYIFPIESGFSEGDLIRSPTAQSFAELTVTPDSAAWKGSLKTTNYKNMYMMRTADGFNTAIEGKALTDEQRTLTIRRGWNGIAYLLSTPMSTRDALADYFDNATVGDLIKSRTQFAVFTENGKWEGSLQTLRPGQGYLLKRQGAEAVTMKYVKSSVTNAPNRAKAVGGQQSGFSNPKAATNMTMIATIAENYELQITNYELLAYIGDELVGVAQPVTRNPSPVTDTPVTGNPSLYFLTIQSDAIGSELRFETADGTALAAVELSTSQHLDIPYTANAHYGTLDSPVVLTPVTGNPSSVTKPYKLIEDDRVIIVRDGERYDVTGVKLEQY
jgi:hypothetical protein